MFSHGGAPDDGLKLATVMTWRLKDLLKLALAVSVPFAKEAFSAVDIVVVPPRVWSVPSIHPFPQL